jgi:hypothetical protein
MATNNASKRNECQAFGSINDDEDHSLDKMKTNTTEENVVARDQMSVGELRQWLAQFGNKQKDHYSNGYNIKKLPQSYSIQERIQQAEARICSTSPSATSSTSAPKVPYNDSIRTALFSKTMSYHNSTQPTLTPKTTEAKVSHHDSTQPTLTPKTAEAKVTYHESIKLASSPVFRTFENYKNMNQAEDSPLTFELSRSKSCSSRPNRSRVVKASLPPGTTLTSSRSRGSTTPGIQMLVSAHSLMTGPTTRTKKKMQFLSYLGTLPTPATPIP